MDESIARAAKDVFETLAMMTRNDGFRAEGPLSFDPGASPEAFNVNTLLFLERARAVVSQPVRFTARDLRNGAMWRDLFDVQRAAHAGYGARSELLASEFRSLASLQLPEGINWKIFEGLDFAAMASKPRERGPRARSDKNSDDDA